MQLRFTIFIYYAITVAIVMFVIAVGNTITKIADAFGMLQAIIM